MPSTSSLAATIALGSLLLAGCKPLPPNFDNAGSETASTDEGDTDESSAGETGGTGGESTSTGESGQSDETESMGEESSETARPWADDGETSEGSGSDTGVDPDPIPCPPTYEKHVIEVEIPARFHALGDIDGDGWIDMVAVGGEGVEWADLVVLMGEGPTTFSPTYLGFDIASQDIDLGDLDGDGDLDIVIPRYYGGFTIFRWMNGGFDEGTTFYPAVPPYIEHIALGDLDGTGTSTC